MSNSKRIALIIAPHQDDEVIGCGGTICKMIEKGYVVQVAHVFLGTSGIPGCSPDASTQRRHQEAVDASLVGNYEILDNLGFIDRSRADDHLIQSKIINLIRSTKPDIIFAPHKNESDHEHRIVSLAVQEASWLAATDIFSDLGPPLPIPPRTLYYEVWKNIDQPVVISDITDYQEVKRSMLNQFRTQMDQTSWVEGSLGRNKYRGTTAMGHGSAEVFESTGIHIEELL